MEHHHVGMHPQEQLVVDEHTITVDEPLKSPRAPYSHRVRQRRQSTGSLRNEVKRRVRLLVPSNHIVRERISAVAGVNRKWDSLTKLEWLKLDSFIQSMFPERYAEATAMLEGGDDYGTVMSTSGGLPELASASAIIGREHIEEEEEEDIGDAGDGSSGIRRVRRRTNLGSAIHIPDESVMAATVVGVSRPIPELTILAKLEELDATIDPTGKPRFPEAASLPRRMMNPARETSNVVSSCATLPHVAPAFDSLRAQMSGISHNGEPNEEQVEYLVLARGAGGAAVALETNMSMSWRQLRKWVTDVFRLHGASVAALDDSVGHADADVDGTAAGDFGASAGSSPGEVENV
jgi:hypothetical protein